MSNYGGNPMDQYNWWQQSVRRTTQSTRGINNSITPQSTAQQNCIQTLDESVIVGGLTGLPVASNSIGPYALQTNIYPAPLFNASTITPYLNVTGLLQDLKVDATFTNIPQDGTVARFAWAIRKTTTPGSLVRTVAHGPSTSGSLAFTPSNAPTPGNLVVAVFGSENGVPTPAAGWQVAENFATGGFTSIIGAIYHVWTSSDTNTESILGIGFSHGCSITTYEFLGADQFAPINVHLSAASAPIASGGVATSPTITPLIAGTEIIAGFCLGTLTGGTAPSSTPSLSAGWAVDQAVVSGGFAGQCNAIAAHASITASTMIPYSCTASFASDWSGTVAMMTLAVNIAGISPWIIQAETSIPGLPFPLPIEQSEYSYGQVSLGIGYDIGAAYVSARGDIGLIGPIAIDYVPANNKLAIPGHYMLNNAAYTPVILPGIASGTPGFPLGAVSIAATASANGMTTAMLVSFEWTNQPTDGSASRVGLWYRQTGATTWSYYGGIPVDGVGQPPALLPTLGVYQFEYADLINATNYQFGMSAEDVAGDETAIIQIIDTSTLPPSVITPPGVLLYGVNEIRDSSMLLTAGPPSGASTLWTYAGFDPTRFHIIPPAQGSPDNMLTADAHGGASVGPVCAYSDLCPVASGQEYCITVTSNLQGGGTQRIAVCDVSDKTANNTTPAAIYNFIGLPVVATGHPQVTNSFNWTATFTGNVVVALYATGITGSCNWRDPQFELGATYSGYKPGPLTGTLSGALAYRISTALDASIVSPSNGQFLLYASNTNSWQNTTLNPALVFGSGAGVILGSGIPSISASNSTIYEDLVPGGFGWIAKVATFPTGTFSDDQIANGSIAQYPIADTSFTGSPNTKFGSAYGNASYNGAGWSVGTSIIADQPRTTHFARGGNAEVDVPITFSSLTNWTVEFVVNPDDGNGSGCYIMGDGPADVAPFKGVIAGCADTPTPEFFFGVGTGSTINYLTWPTGAGAFAGTATYVLALSWDGTNYRMYVNGVLRVTQAGSAPLNPGGGVVAFAECIGHTIPFRTGLNGRLGGISFYASALPASKLLQNYNDLTSTTVIAAGTTWSQIATIGSGTGGGAGVSSLNGELGDINIIASTGASVMASGQGIYLLNTGVTALNGETGAVNIVGSTGVSVTASGQSIFLSATGSGGGAGVSSLNGETGAVSIVGSTGVSATASGSSIFLSNTGVDSLNGETGAVNIVGSTGASVTASGSSIFITASGGVVSLNGEVGALNIVASTGASVTASGSSILISVLPDIDTLATLSDVTLSSPADGQRLVFASATSVWVNQNDIDYPPVYVAGDWIAENLNNVTLVTAVNILQVSPIRIQKSLFITALGCNINSGFSSTVRIRLGIYNADPVTNMPTSLLLDAGQLTPVANGAQSITLGSPQLLVAGLYYLAFVSQGTAQPTMQSAGQIAMRLPRANLTTMSAPNGFQQTAAAAGALPTPFGASTPITSNVPIVAVKMQ